jgi:hypothetical protein
MQASRSVRGQRQHCSRKGKCGQHHDRKAEQQGNPGEGAEQTAAARAADLSGFHRMDTNVHGEGTEYEQDTVCPEQRCPQPRPRRPEPEPQYTHPRPESCRGKSIYGGKQQGIGQVCPHAACRQVRECPKSLQHRPSCGQQKHSAPPEVAHSQQPQNPTYWSSHVYFSCA